MTVGIVADQCAKRNSYLKCRIHWRVTSQHLGGGICEGEFHYSPWKLSSALRRRRRRRSGGGGRAVPPLQRALAEALRVEIAG